MIRTFTERPFSRFVTRTSDPNGSVRCAAISLRSSNVSPLALSFPWNDGARYVAEPSWTRARFGLAAISGDMGRRAPRARMRPSEGSHRDIPNSQANAMPIERPLLQATRTAAPGDGLVLTRKIDLDYLQHSSRAQPWDIDGNTQSELARPDLRHA